MAGFSAAKRILVADDQTAYREGLKSLIAATGDLVVADEATSAQEALCLVRDNDYDLVVLNIAMPSYNGLEILLEIKDMKPELPVLIMSTNLDGQYALRAFKSGVAGYISKESTSLEFIDALQKIIQGRKCMSSALAEALVTGLVDPQSKNIHNSLSNRECQVMCMIASGKPVGAIAKELSLSIKTISTYRSHILRKMNLKNNAELTRYAIENKLV